MIVDKVEFTSGGVGFAHIDGSSYAIPSPIVGAVLSVGASSGHLIDLVLTEDSKAIKRVMSLPVVFKNGREGQIKRLATQTNSETGLHWLEIEVWLVGAQSKTYLAYDQSIQFMCIAAAAANQRVKVQTEKDSVVVIHAQMEVGQPPAARP